MKRLFFFWICLVGAAHAVDGGMEKAYCKKVVLKTFFDPQKAKKRREKILQKIHRSPQIENLLKRSRSKVKLRPSGRYEILVIEPIRQREYAVKILKASRSLYPDAFLGNLDPQKCWQKITDIPFASTETEAKVPKVEKEDSHKSNESVAADTSLLERKRIENEKNVSIRSVLPNENASQKADKKIPALFNPVQSGKKESKTFDKRWYRSDLFRWGLPTAFLFLLSIAIALEFYRRYRRVKNELQNAKEEIAKYKKRIRKYQIFSIECMHEFRVPIHSLDTLGRIYRQNPEFTSDTMIQPMRYIGFYMMGLFNSIYTVENLKNPDFRLEPVPFTLDELLQSIRSVVIPIAMDKNVDFSFDVAKDVPLQFYGDRTKIAQICINLIENAIKFSENGEVEMVVNYRPKREENEVFLYIDIQDNGKGITENEVAYMERNLYCSDEPIEYIFNSPGIGLFTIKRLIKLLHGAIALRKNMVEKGTIVTFKVPLKLDGHTERRKYRLPDKSMLNKKMVIVDTHPRSANALRKMLQYFNYEVTVENSLQKAVDEATKKGVDAIFLDENYLSDEIIHAIETIKNNWPIRFVLIESLANHEKNRALIPAIQYTLPRPFTQKDLFDLIVKMFQ